MSDVFNKEKRSFIMSKVKSSKNSSTELKLISIFKKKAITCWRRNYKIQGKPDFVFKDKKIAIFTDGCFWHGHNCRNTKPKDNEEYWADKIKRNKKRDKAITKILRKNGWQTLRIWECELRDKKTRDLLKKLSLAGLLKNQKIL